MMQMWEKTSAFSYPHDSMWEMMFSHRHTTKSRLAAFHGFRRTLFTDTPAGGTSSRCMQPSWHHGYKPEHLDLVEHDMTSGFLLSASIWHTTFITYFLSSLSMHVTYEAHNGQTIFLKSKQKQTEKKEKNIRLSTCLREWMDL